jgi:methylenetetrahydrofolate dehydrogenase (NADP+)/methenyltetrahydrofolate cyclohydrolase
MAVVIDGKQTSADIREELKVEVDQMIQAGKAQPGLAVVIVGADPASQVYVRNKVRACEQVGLYSEKYELDASVSEEELLGLIDKLNLSDKIHGILVQLPIPDHIDESKVLNAILPEKDVDGFHPINVGKLVVGEGTLLPCTPHGCMVLLERYGVDLKGKEAVVVGRSNIVGKPISFMLLEKHATVTICHSRTQDLAGHIKKADVVVAAVGRPEMVTGDMLKEGAVVIDVGINRTEKGLVGDVEYESASKVASKITPVPGGVGPMTITMLLKNTIVAAKQTNA